MSAWTSPTNAPKVRYAFTLGCCVLALGLFAADLPALLMHLRALDGAALAMVTLGMTIAVAIVFFITRLRERGLADVRAVQSPTDGFAERLSLVGRELDIEAERHSFRARECFAIGLTTVIASAFVQIDFVPLWAIDEAATVTDSSESPPPAPPEDDDSVRSNSGGATQGDLIAGDLTTTIGGWTFSPSVTCPQGAVTTPPGPDARPISVEPSIGVTTRVHNATAPPHLEPGQSGIRKASAAANKRRGTAAAAAPTVASAGGATVVREPTFEEIFHVTFTMRFVLLVLSISIARSFHLRYLRETRRTELLEARARWVRVLGKDATDFRSEKDFVVFLLSALSTESTESGGDDQATTSLTTLFTKAMGR